MRESDQRVPVLGSIPLLGYLFRSRKTDKIKTNLMIFIRAKILRDSMDVSLETNAKYNYIRDIQQSRRRAGVSLMPGEMPPTLPPLESSEQPAQNDSEGSE